MEIQQNPSKIQKIEEYAIAGGRVANIGITFFATMLGNTGKLLSFGITLLVAIITWMGFYNQMKMGWAYIKNAGGLTHLKPQDIQFVATIFQNATSSVAIIAGVLVSVVTVIIGVGLTVKKWGELQQQQVDNQQSGVSAGVSVNIPMSSTPVSDPMADDITK